MSQPLVILRIRILVDDIADLLRGWYRKSRPADWPPIFPGGAT